jgi:hypothetical protein
MAIVVTVFQVPTRSLAVWATAWPGTADPKHNSAIVVRVTVVCRFMMVLPYHAWVSALARI